VATQPYAVAKDSEHKQLAQRLLAAIRARQSEERFLSEGFRWIDGKGGEENSTAEKSKAEKSPAEKSPAGKQPAHE
jgi:hypothetical protein